MSTTLAIFLFVLSLCQARPTTESTHSILQRLGFDPVQRPAVNHHSKRVALETNKARYHDNDVYNSDTDSHMFVVKLPPHPPYYSQTQPEKIDSKAAEKPPMSFRTNGKPARVYHWNIPVIKKLTHGKHKTHNRKVEEDSKIFHVKILQNQDEKAYKKQKEEAHKKYNKYKKHKYEEKLDKLRYHKNSVKLYKFNDVQPKEHVLSIKELAESGMNQLKISPEMEKDHQNDLPVVQKHKNKSFFRKKMNDNYANEVLSEKTRKYSPSFYSPTIPKQNSFHKYFPGNGKPKSFYVIEKSEKPSRYHRLL